MEISIYAIYFSLLLIHLIASAEIEMLKLLKLFYFSGDVQKLYSLDIFPLPFNCFLVFQMPYEVVNKKIFHLRSTYAVGLAIHP